MQYRGLMLAAFGAALSLVGGPAIAADLRAAPLAPEAVVVAPPPACVRWEWRQYSWYDDCWAERHPYIGGTSSYRNYSRRMAVEK